MNIKSLLGIYEMVAFLLQTNSIFLISSLIDVPIPVPTFSVLFFLSSESNLILN